MQRCQLPISYALDLNDTFLFSFFVYVDFYISFIHISLDFFHPSKKMLYSFAANSSNLSNSLPSLHHLRAKVTRNRSVKNFPPLEWKIRSDPKRIFDRIIINRYRYSNGTSIHHSNCTIYIDQIGSISIDSLIVSVEWALGPAQRVARFGPGI